MIGEKVRGRSASITVYRLPEESDESYAHKLKIAQHLADILDEELDTDEKFAAVCAAIIKKVLSQ